MNEHEFNEHIQRELTRIRVELRLQEERLAQQEVRNTRLENRLSRQEQRMSDLEARLDRLVHQYTLLMRYVGLTNEDIQQIQTGSLTAKFLLSNMERRGN